LLVLLGGGMIVARQPTSSRCGGQPRRTGRLSPKGEPMARLEELTRGASVKGILPDGFVTVVDVKWIGTLAVELTYKTAAGALARIIHRSVPRAVAAAGTSRREPTKPVRRAPPPFPRANVLLVRRFIPSRREPRGDAGKRADRPARSSSGSANCRSAAPRPR